MKQVKSLQSSSLRFLNSSAPISIQHYGGRAIQSLQRRYGFIEVPTKLNEFDATQGIKFFKGFYDGRVFDLTLFENAFRVDHQSGTTDECDRFIDDLVGWAMRKGFPFEVVPARLYSSVVEVEFAGDFASIFAPLDHICSLLTKFVNHDSLLPEAYHGTGITFQSKIDGPAPEPFKLERRANTAIADNIFFSSAPLQTKNHLELLSEIDQVLTR